MKPALATARSRFVSLLKSPTATECGIFPTPKLTAGVTNVRYRFPRVWRRSLEPALAIARS